MKDFEDIQIEIEDISENEKKQRSYEKFPFSHPPSQYDYIPLKRKTDFEIYIKKDVYDFIENYSRTNLSRELGGILLGNVYETDNVQFIVIDAAIEARDADSKSVSIRFTHKAWEYINSVKEKKYKDKKIVGWFHTHPSFGIFLSEFDKFICKNFFSLSWQIAYVVDPVNNVKGIFQWKNGELIQSDGLYIYNIGETGKTHPRNNTKIIHHITTIGLIFVTILLFFHIKKLEERNTILKEKINNIKKESVIKYLSRLSEKKEKFVYVVKHGDTLWKISEKIYGIGGIYCKIAEQNNIKAPNMIFPGQKLAIKTVTLNPSEIKGEE